MAEDFPNGGGNRAFLFVVDGPDGRFSWFYQNSASAVDLNLPIVIGGTDYGAPIENLKAALKAEGLESVDLWIGTGGLSDRTTRASCGQGQSLLARSLGRIVGRIPGWSSAAVCRSNAGGVSREVRCPLD